MSGPLTAARAARIARGCAFVAVVVGVLVTLGWLLAVPALTNFGLGGAHTRPASGVVLVLLGTALVLAPSASARARGVALALAGWVVLVALVTLLWPRGGGPWGDEVRSSPLTAGAYGAMAFATLAVLRRAGYALVAASTTVGLVLVSVALLDTSAHIMVGGADWRALVALPATLGIAATGVSVYYQRPDEGLVRLLHHGGVVGVVSRRLCAASVLVPIVVGLSRQATHRLELVSVPMGITLFAVTMALAIGAISAWTARTVDRLDAERQQVRAELARSEATFRGAYEHTAVGMALVSPTGKFLRANATLCKLLGYTEAELCASGFQDVTEPADLAEDLRLVTDVLDGRIEHYVLEKRYRHREGRVVWGLLSVSLVRRPDGAPDYFVSTIQDITPLRRARAELEDTLRIQRAITHSANVSIIATDLTGTITAFSPAAERLLGYLAVEVIGRSTPEPFHERDEVVREAGALSRRLGRTIEPGFEVFVAEARDHVVSEKEWTYLSKSGERVPVFLSVTALTGVGGDVDGFLGIATDIRERKAAEAKLAYTRSMLEFFIAHAPASIAMFDRDMRYVASTRMWSSDYHLTQPLVGRSHYEVFPEISAAWREVHRRALAGEVVSAEEDRFDRADGTSQWLRWQVRPWSDERGAIGGIIMFTADVTEERRMKEEIKASLAEKVTLLREIHHRVKNNMQIITSILRLQAGATPDLFVREVLADCRQRIATMSLVHEKLYSGQNLARLDLGAHLRDLVELQRAASSQATSVALEVIAEPLDVGADVAIPFGLIVNELVANTYKHAFAGRTHGHVRIELSRGLDGLVLTVVDDGVGMAQEIDIESTRSLGLRLVRSLVAQLQGTLTLARGQPGTTICVTAPTSEA
jgi:PAS domain S-box-containing protein